MQANDIHVAAGERMAREQPAAHFLYQSIDALSGIDKLKLRQRLGASPQPSARGAAHARRSDAVADRRGGCRLSAVPVRRPGAHDAEGQVAQVANAGHSVYFERPAEFNRIVDAFLALP